MKELLDQLELDGIVGTDFETFWANDFTLKHIPTTEYITDPRFKSHMASVQWHSEKRAHVLSHEQLLDWVSDVDWKRTGLLAHHTQFDGLIASHHYGVKPAFYFDTMSMSRPIMPVTVGGSLVALSAAFGRRAKKHGSILLDTKGLRDLSPAQFKKMAKYAGGDIEDTWFLFHKFLPFTALRELYLIDRTIRMYACPRILINGPMVQKLHDTEVREKGEFLKRLKVTKKELTSKNQFADLLMAEGIDPPLKYNKKGEPIYAFAKTDLAFKKLLGHSKKRVRDLVGGRFRLSTNILEKRALRMARRAPIGPQPIYLNYAAALTLRHTGGDKINWQNLNRGSDLRNAIEAPAGYEFIIADSSQIEARLNACFAGQKNKVEQFRKADRTGRDEDDVYAMTASDIYGRQILKKRDPHERFVGKVADLSLGYQAGAPRFAHTLRVGQMGPPVDITDEDAQSTVQAWRFANEYIRAGWRETQNLVKAAFVGNTRIEHRCGVFYEGKGGHGFMHLPNGMSIRYTDVQVDEEDGGLSYLRRVKKTKEGETRKRTRLYGGLEVENRTQALGRVLLADWIVETTIELPKIQLVTTTHDEVVYITKKGTGERYLEKVIRPIMTRPPTWMPDLPLNIDARVAAYYEKP